MATIKINLEKLKPIPNGVYNVFVKNVKLKESKASFNKYLSWQLEVSKGQYKGAFIFMSTSLSSNALWRIKKVFDVIGMGYYEDFIEFDPNDLQNRKFQVKVQSDEFNGKIYNEVVECYPSD